MELQETPPKNPPTELTFNVLNGATGQRLNAEPLSEEAARKLASTLQESDASTPLVIRSNRATLME
jgi:hypothetical protein